MSDQKALYHEHYADVLRVVTARLGCPDAAADVAQETFARAYQAHAAGQVMTNPRAWLLRTARNLCVDHWRDQQRWAVLPDEVVSDERCDPEWAVLQAAQADRLHKALLAVSPKARAALIMRDVEREPVGQIADRLEVTVGSASVILHRARGRVRRAYEAGRGMLMPPGLVKGLRRLVARVTPPGQPLFDGANAVCASACAAVTVIAMTAAVVQSQSKPAAVNVQLSSVERLPAAERSSAPRAGQQVAATRTRNVPKLAPTRAERADHASSAGSPTSEQRRTEASDRAELKAPGATVWTSSQPPDEEPSTAVEVDEEVGDHRIEAGTRIYSDDVRPADLLPDHAPAGPLQP